MSLFIGTLTDDLNGTYDYGHCYRDHGDGSETGCGMEYAYYPDREVLEFWHDSVGHVHTRENFARFDQTALDRLHESCHVV